MLYYRGQFANGISVTGEKQFYLLPHTVVCSGGARVFAAWGKHLC